MDELMNQNDLIKSIESSTDPNELKDLINLFNVAQTKKNMIRITKLNDVLEDIDAQISQRFKQRAGEFNNQDLLKYMESIQASIEKSQKNSSSVSDIPLIQLNANTINVTPGSELSKESRDNILDFIKSVLDTNQPVTTIDLEEAD